MGKSYVGRAIHRRERYKNDERFKNKFLKKRKEYYKKNKSKIRERFRKREKQLSEFVGKKCLICEKILHYRTQGEYCSKHKKYEKTKDINKTGRIKDN